MVFAVPCGSNLYPYYMNHIKPFLDFAVWQFYSDGMDMLLSQPLNCDIQNTNYLLGNDHYHLK